MKKSILLLSIVALFYSCEKQEALPPNTYEITATAKGVHNGMRAYVKFYDDKKKEVLVDTAIIMNEEFKLYGKIKNPALRLISINGISGNLPFVLESGRASIEINKDSIYYSKVTGTKNNEDYNLFKDELKKREKIVIELREQITLARTNNPELVAELMVKNRKLTNESREYIHDFIEAHPKSEFSLLLLESYLNTQKPNIEGIKKSYILLADVINKNPVNKLIGQKIEAVLKIAEAQANLDIGRVAPNFTSTTPTGETISLNDIKGKVTIIEFWAAWCGPCRRENPNIVKVYNKYHEKGLEIIGISLDGTGRQKDPKATWLKAIEDDKLTWHQVSSLKYFNDPVARLYNINAIPAAFILDENGVIVAKNLRGQALENQIASMLD